jgi:Zn-finger nucleic acid-binding protein
MDEQTEWPCPECGIGLFEASGGDVTVWGCGKCGGQWLDNKGCHQLVGGTLSPRARELAGQASAVARADAAQDPSYRAPGAAARDARSCPFCRDLLARHMASGGIELDVCLAHGAWFDPYELLRIAHNVDLDAGARLAAAYEARDRRIAQLDDRDHARAVNNLVRELLRPRDP